MTSPRREKPSPLGRRWRARAPDEGKMPGRCPSSVTCGDALRGEGDSQKLAFVLLLVKFKSMPSVGRATLKNSRSCCCWSNFNPRPPRGGRPALPYVSMAAVAISIHVLREEDDRTKDAAASLRSYFNPRPPRGGRPHEGRSSIVAELFQSTSSARRTTVIGLILGTAEIFQSTSSARRTTV